MTPRLAARLAAAAALTSCLACAGGGAEPPGTAPATPTATAPAAPAPEAPPAGLRLPDTVRPTAAALEMTVIPSEETLTGRATIDVELAARTSTIWLHAVDLEITSSAVTAGGAEVASRAAPAAGGLLGVHLGAPIGPGPARIVLAYRAKMDAAKSEGVYRQAEGADWFAYTVFEPLDARRAFPSFDEPGFKIPWQITLHVKKEHVALANAPIAREEDAPNGMKRVIFAPSKPLPSYLVAFVVGPFEIVDEGPVGRGVRLRFVVPRGRAGELGYARRVTPRVVSLLEEYFGIPYPFEKLDIAIVPRAYGTMEHPGLVAMGQPIALIPAGEETAARQQEYAWSAMHELAHIWLGDYVTHAWWDDLWLTEALATWMDLKLTARLDPAWQYELERMPRTEWVLRSDGLVSARRLREPVRSSHDISAAFDGITYDKGAAVIRMFERWAGEEKMRAGMQVYLRRHAWKSATSEDLLAALSEATSPAIAPALRTFLDQPGVPLVSLALRCPAGGAPSVELAQRRLLPAGSTGSADARWQVPVCFAWGTRTRDGEQCALLTDVRAEMPLEGAKACPAWVLGNAGATGYYRARYDERALDALLGGALAALTPAERLVVTYDLQALASAGEVTYGSVLARLPALVTRADTHLLLEAAYMASSVRKHLVPDALQGAHARFVARLFGARARALGWTARPGDTDADRRLRAELVPFAANAGGDDRLIAEARRLTPRYLEDRSAVADDVADGLLATAARHGDRALFDRMVAAARAEKSRGSRERLLAALGGFRDPEVARAALALLLSDDFDPRESQGLLWRMIHAREGRDVAWAFVRQHIDALAARLTGEEAARLPGLGRAFCDEGRRAEVEALFGERAKKYDGGPRSLAQTLEAIDLCVAQKKIHQESVAAFLKKQ